jgi:hypothetical protein
VGVEGDGEAEVVGFVGYALWMYAYEGPMWNLKKSYGWRSRLSGVKVEEDVVHRWSVVVF